MKEPTKTDRYSEEEAKQRMVAALKGARLAGHVPMKAKKAKKASAGKRKNKPKRP